MNLYSSTFGPAYLSPKAELSARPKIQETFMQGSSSGSGIACTGKLLLRKGVGKVVHVILIYRHYKSRARGQAF